MSLHTLAEYKALEKNKALLKPGAQIIKAVAAKLFTDVKEEVATSWAAKVARPKTARPTGEKTPRQKLREKTAIIAGTPVPVPVVAEESKSPDGMEVDAGPGGKSIQQVKFAEEPAKSVQEKKQGYAEKIKEKKLAALKKNLKDPLIWVDLEMTGLDISKEQIIEIAVIVTDGDLKHQLKGPNLVVHCPDALLDGMDAWCTKTHGESGLTQRVRESKLTLADAEAQVMEFLEKTCGLKTFTCPLAGNSVHADKIFLHKDMPRLHSFLHYRIVDVSTIKELVKRWMPSDKFKAPPKKLAHRALEDIEESIEELKFYQKVIFDVAK